MTYVFTPAAPVGVPVAGTDQLYTVRRVYCVGRNYAAHAREMGSDPTREPPFFFCKPGDAVAPVRSGTTGEIAYPPRTANFHHEIELVVAIGRAGRDISVEAAPEHIYGYAVGLDMTRRDLQLALRDKGRPWELGKAFDQSAPIGEIHPVSAVGHPVRGAVWLRVDGTERQRGDISDLIWSVPEVIANLSQYFTLQPGDLIYTGTPEGVAAVTPGALLHGGIDGLGELRVAVR